LEPFSDRSKITGPGVTLGAQQAQTFALAIHELATNAAKHGALSNPWGELLVSWKLANNGEAGGLNFDWLEIGGPPIAAEQTRRGFGTALIESAFNGALFEYSKTGLLHIGDLRIDDDISAH